MSKLHIFDMDGTLLPGSASLELSRHMGQLEAVEAIEERWSRGEVGHVEYYEISLPLWTGLSDEDVEEVFRAIAWVDRIPEVWADIARRGERSAVISLSPQFFAERLLRWGLHSAHGAEVEAGVFPDPSLVLTPDSKVEIAEELMQRYGVGASDCVAYGDSVSDVPLFDLLSNTVAVNGTEALRRAAAASYEGADLWAAYEMGRDLLARSAEEADELLECGKRPG
ncbi:MAG: HAD-IB family phosphatase [Solirubrobacterales bacterium]